MPLLDIHQLSISFKGDQGIIPAVRGLDLTIEEGEIVGLVGESGSGKSVTANQILQLNHPSSIYDQSGTIIFEGENLAVKSRKEMEQVRGKKIGIIFQDSYSSLNPTMTVGDQLIETLMKHLKLTKDQAFERGIKTLFNLGINQPIERMNQLPFELSGGIRQRVLFAIAISSEPSLLIADEPTSCLDVMIQWQILQLMKNLKMSILFISHDLSLVSRISDRVYVMYAGKIVEKGTTEEIFSNPKHPYTKALLCSIPKLSAKCDEPLQVIPGCPPHPSAMPSGCAFHPRCPHAMTICQQKDPSEDMQIPYPCWIYHPKACKVKGKSYATITD